MHLLDLDLDLFLVFQLRCERFENNLVDCKFATQSVDELDLDLESRRL